MYLKGMAVYNVVLLVIVYANYFGLQLLQIWIPIKVRRIGDAGVFAQFYHLIS